MAFVLGIDGGGTSCKAAPATVSGDVIGHGKSGPANIRTDLTVASKAEGWDPLEWRAAATDLAREMSWTPPNIPAPGDPGPFRGSPAVG